MKEIFPGSEQVVSAETLYVDSKLTVARITLNGLNWRIINHASTTTYHVISGEGVMIVDDTIHKLEGDISVTILKGTPYHDEGTVEMIAISVPPFDPSSIEYID